MKSRSLGDILANISGREGVKMNPFGVLYRGTEAETQLPAEEVLQIPASLP